MQKQMIAAVAASCAVVFGTVGLAGPAVAAQDPPWLMPDVNGEVLNNAVEAVLGITGPEIDLRFQTKGNQPVINQTNWVVCAQSPGAGNEISQKTKRVILQVKRPDAETCS